ncbi:MAG: histidinol-phosphate transaminase [Chloroflexi bacterium]|nr:histidinol-phosphate transaminase [Chloroflexota bacterium]MDA1218549.1 histidinol-phosphate transaminase [Chloroflexota bacterium]
MESFKSQISQGMDRPVHGNIKPAELRRLGLDPAEVIDFSASISPIGPPPGLWEALNRVDLTTYPDPECLDLREALSSNLGVGLERILGGNGTTEIIHLLTRAYLPSPQGRASNTALLLNPTYGEYIGACRLVGASIFNLNAHYSDGFHWDIPEAQAHITAQQPGLVFVCNPNNPTGVYLPEADIRSMADAVGEAGGLLVLDEAYINFVDNPWQSQSLIENGSVVLLRSMTKDYALTGLRLGYALAAEPVIARLASFQPDWSVNSLAQAAGLVALADAEYLPKAREAVKLSKEFLTTELTSLGFTVLPSSANFLLVQVGNGTIMRDKLLQRGLVVRDCASFGIADCIRIGIRALPDCQRLAAAMGEAV